MKVLVTAKNNAALRTETKLRKVKNSVAAYVKALRDIGHEVDWRRAEMDEDPTKYDVIIANMVPPLSMVADSAMPILKLLVRASERGVPFITSVDDYKTTGIPHRYYRLSVNPGLIIGKDFHAGRRGYEWASGNVSEFVDTCYKFSQLKPTTIACAFGFGSDTGCERLRERLGMNGDVVFLDPTSYIHHEYLPQPSYLRERIWSMSALAWHGKILSKYEWGWPGEYFTSARQTAIERAPGPAAFVPKKPITQPEIIKRYGQVWGAPLIPYSQTRDSGWWRDRWFTVPRSGAVLWADPADCTRLINFKRSPAEIEALTDAQLIQLSALQREEIDDWIWSRECLQHRLDELLIKACDK